MGATTPIYALDGKRVWVAGHRGMVGSALVRRLDSENCSVLTVARDDVDLLNQADVMRWLDRNRPHAVFLAAAKVGGILANSTYPADFLYQNLVIEANIVEGARKAGVEKLLFLGSSCIYPKFAHQPMREEELLTGPLESTNEWYAIAKIAGLKLAEAYRRQYGCDFISAMPTNLYGPFDNFDLETSHVLPALVRKAHEAKMLGAAEMTIWGTGSVKREFLHVDDCAGALVFLLKNYSDAMHVNVGTGEDIAIIDVARRVARVVGFRGEIVRDASKPDGTPRKLLDVSRLTAMGWTATIGLEKGIEDTYRWFLANRVETD